MEIEKKEGKWRGRRGRGGGGGGGGGGFGGVGGAIAINTTSTKVVCFFRFLLRLSVPLMFAASSYSTRYCLY